MPKSQSLVCAVCRVQQTGNPGEQLERQVSSCTQVSAITSAALGAKGWTWCGDPAVVAGAWTHTAPRLVYSNAGEKVCPSPGRGSHKHLLLNC